MMMLEGRITALASTGSDCVIGGLYMPTEEGIIMSKCSVAVSLGMGTSPSSSLAMTAATILLSQTGERVSTESSKLVV
jgi:hypothetical protein